MRMWLAVLRGLGGWFPEYFILTPKTQMFTMVPSARRFATRRSAPQRNATAVQQWHPEYPGCHLFLRVDLVARSGAIIVLPHMNSTFTPNRARLWCAFGGALARTESSSPQRGVQNLTSDLFDIQGAHSADCLCIQPGVRSPTGQTVRATDGFRRPSLSVKAFALPALGRVGRRLPRNEPVVNPVTANRVVVRTGSKCEKRYSRQR